MEMRTTLTIEDGIDRKLKALARKTGKSYKQVVNETLKHGLAVGDRAARSYKLRPASMGAVDHAYDLDRALALADAMEDEEIVRKLTLRK